MRIAAWIRRYHKGLARALGLTEKLTESKRARQERELQDYVNGKLRSL